ncbi:MAG: hypothetical protein IJE89_01220 [Bacilli bacterium]|nr:hypothetical protein [Bacilli bacterium]
MQKKEAIKNFDENDPEFLKAQKDFYEKMGFDYSAYSYAITEYKLKRTKSSIYTPKKKKR